MESRQIEIQLNGSGETDAPVETGIINGVIYAIVLNKNSQTADPAFTITTADGYPIVDAIAESGTTPTPYLVRVPPVEPDGTAITVQFEPLPNAGNLYITVASGDNDGICYAKIYWSIA